ncbi:hypothetical protein FDJ28_gp49 [Pseudomonas phage Bjorn]|uniref:Uncharacterized protein n=1 Tax=Pseudomonas phage Bjorn TaxID=2079288 RepID=A0A2K9VHR5_9CAUD|nr:hypothetical protein FDJ28_gp49 [Pseudomonas phage Bjorn]AUV61795.1 hypothetical protein PsPhBjorn_gp21 [Pseudomonas phage Bjorn]
MPQSNVQIQEVDLRSDMRSYYRNSVCTHEGNPVLVTDFSGNGETLKAHVCKLRGDGAWSDPKVVLYSSLDVNIPTLGYVFLGDAWHHLSRVPARRMRKGYNTESIAIKSTNRADGIGPFNAFHPDIIRQIWHGNPDRLNHDSVIWRNCLWFQGDVVGKIVNGKVTLTPGKEKIGEYVCKLLAANWEYHSSKHSLLPLDL